MKAFLFLILAASVANSVEAFAPTTTSQASRSLSLSGSSNDEFATKANDRRQALSQATKFFFGVALSFHLPLPAFAEQILAAPKVVVAGATGQTGRRVLERLTTAENLQVIGTVRNVEKATVSLGQSSNVLRGAKMEKVSSVDTSSVELKRLDVVEDSVDEIAKTMEGATFLVIGTAFVPDPVMMGNPFKMKTFAHEVDNVGTIKLIDAAKKTGTVKKIVMLSSILTNGRSWGQEKSVGFAVTNALGNVLDEKLVAENYLRQSGIEYTIIRSGGLKSTPPTGSLKISGEDTLNNGEISRDLVADVCVASLRDAKASNKVLEIIEDEGF